MLPVAGQPGRPPHKPCFRTACPETPQKISNSCRWRPNRIRRRALATCGVFLSFALEWRVLRYCIHLSDSKKSPNTISGGMPEPD